MNDLWNKLMGLGFLGTILWAGLMFWGPKDSEGHLPWWSYLIASISMFLFFIGHSGAKKYRTRPPDS